MVFLDDWTVLSCHQETLIKTIKEMLSHNYWSYTQNDVNNHLWQHKMFLFVNSNISDESQSCHLKLLLPTVTVCLLQTRLNKSWVETRWNYGEELKSQALMEAHYNLLCFFLIWDINSVAQQVAQTHLAAAQLLFGKVQTENHSDHFTAGGIQPDKSRSKLRATQPFKKTTLQTRRFKMNKTLKQQKCWCFDH